MTPSWGPFQVHNTHQLLIVKLHKISGCMCGLTVKSDAAHHMPNIAQPCSQSVNLDYCQMSNHQAQEMLWRTSEEATGVTFTIWEVELAAYPSPLNLSQSWLHVVYYHMSCQIFSKVPGYLLIAPKHLWLGCLTASFSRSSCALHDLKRVAWLEERSSETAEVANVGHCCVYCYAKRAKTKWQMVAGVTHWSSPFLSVLSQKSVPFRQKTGVNFHYWWGTWTLRRVLSFKPNVLEHRLLRSFLNHLFLGRWSLLNPVSGHHWNKMIILDQDLVIECKHMTELLPFLSD